MPKDVAYHECAIRYNKTLAEFAENLAETLEVEDVKKWCTAVAKQHRFHEDRHGKSLENLKAGKKKKKRKKHRPEEAPVATSKDELSPEEVARLDAQIDRIHGAGAAAALDEAIADGSIFSDSSRDDEPTLFDEAPDAAPVEEAGPDPLLAAEPVDAGVGTNVNEEGDSLALDVPVPAKLPEDVIEIQPGVTRPMTEQEKADRAAADEQEVVHG